MKIIFLLLKLAFAYTQPCIVFYTGGSNIISTQLYSDFLSNIDNIDIYKIPFRSNNKKDIFFNNLKKKYSSINLVGHSSGCVRAINNCNENIDNLILLDPVKTPYWCDTKNLNYLNKILIINAAKSYKWSYIPPFVPFIPFFKLELDDININKDKVTIITVKDYGHSDIIDNPWRDIMHYSRLSLGYNKRDNINKYHKFLSNIIRQFINIKPKESETII
jgi:hypothetical protein